MRRDCTKASIAHISSEMCTSFQGEKFFGVLVLIYLFFLFSEAICILSSPLLKLIRKRAVASFLLDKSILLVLSFC